MTLREANLAARFQLDGRDHEAGMWERGESCEASQYAFLVEWVQELKHRGRVTRFRMSSDGPGDADLRDRDDRKKDANASSGSGIDGAIASIQPCSEASAIGGVTVDSNAGPSEEGTAAACKVPVETQVVRLRRQLNGADMALIAEEVACFATEAHGARLTFVVAPRVHVEAVDGRVADGSPRTIRFQRAEQLESAEGEEVPVVWIGEVSDFVPDGDIAILLRVRRRDWRIDPYALALVRSPVESGGLLSLANGLAANRRTVTAPPGPEVWSTSKRAPSVRSADFVRCSDRELVLYELHVGSFTREGTFNAAAARLEHVKHLGCNVVSMMPIHQDLRRMTTGNADWWGYDIISLFAVDSVYGTLEDLAALIARAHALGLAVVIDYVANHMVWGSDALLGPQYFLSDQHTVWGPRPDFSRPQVYSYALSAAEFLLDFGFDGLRVDSTKSIRKLPDSKPDPAGGTWLNELTSLCRRRKKLAIAEDLEDGDGFLQFGGLGFHLQWDMALFCWSYDALVNPMDEFRDMSRVVKGLGGLCASRNHPLRGRVVFMESHDTATSDRYGRLTAAVHNGKAFMSGGGAGMDGDAFQQTGGGLLDYPDPKDVESNPYAIRRAAIGLVILMTAPGVPMLLQGQELCDCRPFRWPRGPAMDWHRAEQVEKHSASSLATLPRRWHRFCQDLIGLRSRRGLGIRPGRFPSTANASNPPLVGDGIHTFFCDGGVLAFLRWSEGLDDSRAESSVEPELVLIVLNCTHQNYPSFLLGIPPSNAWRLALSSAVVAKVAGDADAQATFARAQPETELMVFWQRANHGFPCSIDVPLPAYSGNVFFREA